MAVSAQLETPRWIDARRAPRRRLQLGSVLTGSGEGVVVHDLSVTGFRIETSADLAPGEMLQVELPRCGPTPACVVWRDDRIYGCVFPARIPGAAISAAVLRGSVPPGLPSAECAEAVAAAAAEHSDEERRYSSLAKSLVIVGLSVLLWAAIFGAVILAG